ncbi:hypothetical protein IQ274_35570 [Nostoc sp. LEGE 12447]|uniref:hypothetical protein n=1 Tax=Nostoc sp. LEGE 12447 TaxID=1828640 RepID=UPI0018838D2D|nr:hypothetical protein [Nostoc sp. LEGE 12447]MBE9003335.1 hypothetical protein [Nostoc sp. LEGE 12447]
MKLKILEQTSTLLKLQLKPAAILYWFFGGFFIAGGVLLITTLAKTTTFTCNRVEPTQESCQLITKSILKSQVKTWNLKEVIGAKLDTSTTAGNSYPLVLVTSNGSIPIDLVNADSTQKESKAAQINAYLKNSREAKLTIHEDSRLWTYPLGLFLIASGAVCIIYMLMNGTIICIFDKTLDKATIKREGWFGKEVVEAKLSEISGLNMDAVAIDTVTGTSSTSYNIVLNLVSDKNIYLAAGPMFTAKSAEQTLNAIASFLN